MGLIIKGRVPSQGGVFPAFSLSMKQIEPRKKPSYFPLYWLVNRDPYNGLL